MKKYFTLDKTAYLKFFVILFLGSTNVTEAQIAQRGVATTATSSANTITINKPAGVVAGDLMIVSIASNDNNSLVGSNASSVLTGAAGWTLQSSITIGNNNHRGSVLYRVADGTEAGSFAFNVPNVSGTTDDSVGAIIAFLGVNITTPFDTNGVFLAATANTVTATSITTTTANAGVVMLAMGGRNDRSFTAPWSTTSPGTLTELYDTSNQASVGAAWAIKAAAGATGNGTVAFSANDRNSGILLSLRRISPPTITSFAASGCQGSSLIITGTNLIGTTNVTIGGTAVTITGTTATTVTVTTGSSSGQVAVTTPGGSANSGASLYTSNPLPAVPGNPTSNSPQCNPGGVTITQSGSAPAGVTWYWQTAAANTSTANNASTPLVVNTSGTYYIRSRNDITSCWSNGAGSVTVVVNNPINTLATPTAPINGATGVCYSGTGATTTLSWGAAAGATGYDVYFGTTNPAPTMVSSNQAGTTWLIAPVLTANTTYYWRIEPRNVCGLTTGTPVNWSFTTGSAPCYCTPSSSSGLYYIAGVSSEGTLTNGSNTPTTYSAGGYGNYTAITIARQIPGGGININIDLAGAGGQGMRTYVDWNNDGIFADPAEEVYNTGTTLLTGPTTYGFVVPPGQAPGNYRMRIRSRGATAIDPCSALGSGEAEDYTIIIVADCTQKITSITNGSSCGSPNTVNLLAVSAGATGFRWYSAETGGSLLADVAGSGNWTTPSIAATTTYYVTAYNGTCESLYRTPIKATILTTTNITVTPSAPILCGENIPISITAAGDTIEEDLLVQDFESGMAPFTATIPTNTNAGADSPWSVKTSPYQPSGTSVWKPAINSGSVATTGNKFALSSSDYNGSNIVSIITSPVINPSAYTSLTLTFDQYYSYFSGDSGAVQVSVNGGAFAAVSPTPALYNSDIGTPSDFTTQTVNLNAYALPGNTSLQFRFVYTAQFDDGWAIDNIKLSGIKPLNTTFTWSGGVDAFTDAACTIPYVAQSVATIYVKPNATQLTNTSWAFTATATLSNGCSAVKNITVTNNTKSWTGANSTLWNDANNWVPSGVPSVANCVVIPSIAQITGSGYNALAKNVTVKSTGNLELQSSNNLTVSDEITVVPSGIFNIRNSANLVQVNNLANSGTINMDRITNIRRQDYVYWSSPVASFPVTSISPGSGSYIYKWLPTTPTSYASNFGNWSNTAENMIIGKGYIVRGPNAYPTSVLTSYNATFTGVPNNGAITTPISRSTYNGASYTGPSTTLVTANDDNWNLIGNPYPSSIRAIDFLNANSNIAGFINLWTHGTLPVSSVDPFYADFVYNYTAADYITYNVSGVSSGPGTFNGYIGAGQSFFVLMNHTSAATTETVTFNNSMRSSSYSNSQFYRTSQDSILVEPERNRIWLDLIKSSDNTNRRTLVGYIEGATNAKDRLFDALSDEKMDFNIYSLLDNETQIIQGRALPFDSNDTVPLGVSIPQNGGYQIGIAAVDGLFADVNQKIYLEDLSTGIIHNLKSAPYSFTANAGILNDRFVLRYTNTPLSVNEFDYASGVKIYTNDNINITSAYESIKNVTVYDILGKTISDKKNIGKKDVVLTELKPTSAVLIVKVILDNNAEIVKKVIY